jgi:WD40 repeat protein
MRNNKILIIVIFSALGIICSSILMVLLNNFNSSWNYFLTDDPNEQYSTCAMSENGKFVVVGSGNNFLYLFKDDMQMSLWSYKMKDDVVSVDISADGNYIVACDAVGNVLVFTRQYPVPIWSYKGFQHSVAKISANGKYVAFLNRGNLYLYSREEDLILWSYNFNGMDLCIDISADGNEIVTCIDGILYYFEKSSFSPQWQYKIGNVMNDLVISPSGELIALGGQNNRVDLFSNTDPVPIKKYNTGFNVHSISISEEKSSIAVVCAGGCYLYNTNDDTCLWSYSMEPDSSEVALSSDGNFIVGGDMNYDKERYFIHCLNKYQNVPLWSIRVQGTINKLAISNDGESIGVVTQKYFYFIDRSNPIIYDWYSFLLYLNYVSLILSVGFTVVSGLLYTYNILIPKKLIKDIGMDRKEEFQITMKYCPNCMLSSRQKEQIYCEFCGSKLI